MKFAIIAIVIVAIVIGILWLKSRSHDGHTPALGNEKPRAKQLLSNREQAMFNRLTESLPSLVVLAQVSFGALLTAKQRTTRNTFDRKIADFAICSKAFEVLAVIELDDASHRSKKDRDESRDQMLMEAGYDVLRYENVPDRAKIEKDLNALLAKRRAMTTPKHNV